MNKRITFKDIAEKAGLNTGARSKTLIDYSDISPETIARVKCVASGQLRSLHEFMDRCPHSYAIRIYGEKLRIDELTTTKRKTYKPLNLPYFLSSWIRDYLIWLCGR